MRSLLHRVQETERGHMTTHSCLPLIKYLSFLLLTPLGVACKINILSRVKEEALGQEVRGWDPWGGQHHKMSLLSWAEVHRVDAGHSGGGLWGDASMESEAGTNPQLLLWGLGSLQSLQLTPAYSSLGRWSCALPQHAAFLTVLSESLFNLFMFHFQSCLKMR